jgi:hypothetical protein
MTQGMAILNELIRMFEETPDANLYIGKNKKSALTFRDDRKIKGLFRRDGNDIIIDYDDFDGNGELRLFSGE